MQAERRAAHGVLRLHQAGDEALGGRGRGQAIFGARSIADLERRIADWLLDNYYKRGRGLAPKEAGEYKISYELDLDGDGVPDGNDEAALYDLRLKHTTHDAYIWLRTFPISTDLRQKELRVLVQRYVDAVAGAGFEAVKLGASVAVQERRFAPELIERGTARLAGHEAYLATFDVANVDELAVSPGARRTRVQVVLVRPPFTYRHPRSGAEFPVLMLAGYANLPEDFENDLPSFLKLLRSIQIGGDLGWTDVRVEPVRKSDTVTDATAAASVSPPSTEPAPGEAAPAEATPADAGVDATSP